MGSVRRWSPDEDEQLRNLARAGKNALESAGKIALTGLPVRVPPPKSSTSPGSKLELLVGRPSTLILNASTVPSASCPVKRHQRSGETTKAEGSLV